MSDPVTHGMVLFFGLIGFGVFAVVYWGFLTGWKL